MSRLQRTGSFRLSGIRGTLKIAAGVPALGFLIMGLVWWIAPASAGSQLGMELLGGTGLSTQIADLAAFFLTLGGSILVGLASADRVWFFPPLMLLGFAIVGRLVAWHFHGAELAFEMIAAESFVFAVLLLNVRDMAKART